ncbi:MAG: AAA family ATPase [Treponemataceae bacterium]
MNQEIKERLEKSLEKFGVSQNKAAMDMGYSGAVLSSYRSGAYKGDVEKLENSIISWIARNEKALSQKKVPIVETDLLKVITNAIGEAHTTRDIALITADAGAGKTSAAKFYEKQNPTTVIYINIVSGTDKKMLVLEIARQLSIVTTKVNQNVLVKQVADTLASKDMVVILDEADYLKNDALEFTRRLVYDLGQSGLVLIGLPTLAGTIQNLRNDHRQLESRIGIYLNVSGLSKKDASLIAKTVWGDDVSNEVIDAIYAISRTDARQFTKIIARTQSVMALNKLELPTLEAVELGAKRIIRRNFAR